MKNADANTNADKPTPNLFLRFQFALITFIALILKGTIFDILNLNKRK